MPFQSDAYAIQISSLWNLNGISIRFLTPAMALIMLMETYKCKLVHTKTS